MQYLQQTMGVIKGFEKCQYYSIKNIIFSKIDLEIQDEIYFFFLFGIVRFIN